jgi:ABC-type amino acid transport substrate-binding protein
LSELPIFPFNHSAVTLKDSGLTIRSLEDLRGHVVILIENFQYPGLEEYLAGMNDDNAGTPIGILRAFTPGGALEMLKHGRGDVVIEWQARAIYNLPAAGLKYQDVEFHDATSIVPTKNMHLVFSTRQSDEFRNYVNSSIKTLRDSGQLHELVKEYYFPALPPNF